MEDPELEIDLAVRSGRADDLTGIARIYDHYVVHSTCTFHVEPWTADEYGSWFRERTADHPIVVAERAGEIVGWGSLSPWKPREAYRHTVEISVYVDPTSLREGIGRALAIDLVERARALGHRSVVGTACAENGDGLALLEGLGFEEVGRLRRAGTKFGRSFDVVHVQLVL